MDYQDIYIVSEAEKELPEYIGFETDCQEWINVHELKRGTTQRLSLYLREFLPHRTLLTKVLANIISQVQNDSHKKNCTDLSLANMIRGGWHKIGGKIYLQNLCTAISTINTPVIQLYESHCQVRSYRIKEVFTESSDPRRPANRRKLI